MGIIRDNIEKIRREQGKNYIINGNFDVWQRGTTQSSNGYGSDDRWHNSHNGTTKTVSRIACTDIERALFNAAYIKRHTVSSVAGASNQCLMQQHIEDVTKLAGKTITISFWAKADSNKNIAIELNQLFGTGGSPSAIVTSIGSTLVALTSTWQKKSITIKLPSIIGKTLGTDGVNTSSTVLLFWFDAGSSFLARTGGLTQQSGTFDIAQVQLEEGSIATNFEQRTYLEEKNLCGITDNTKAFGYNYGDWAADDARAVTALNATGTAPIYACRAWVNFNGTGTVAIRGSGNVSSITDNGTGNYTVNFTTSMADANYVMGGGASGNSAQAKSATFLSAPLTSSCQIGYGGNGTQDSEYCTFFVIK
jgi:hypothetical protein